MLFRLCFSHHSGRWIVIRKSTRRCQLSKFGEDHASICCRVGGVRSTCRCGAERVRGRDKLRHDEQHEYDQWEAKTCIWEVLLQHSARGGLLSLMQLCEGGRED